MTRIWISAVALLTIFLLSASAAAQSVSLAAERDTSLYSESTGSSNGAGDHMFTGRTDSGSFRRALLAFDVAGAVPAGSTVTGVTLTLYLSRTKTNALDVSLHQLLADWGEAGSDAFGEEGTGIAAELGDATWSHRFWDTTLWTNPGGDFSATVSATTSVGIQTGYYAWSSPGIVADVQGWLDAPATNYGWLILADTSADKETKRFDTRENPDGSRQPVLDVTFTSPSPIGACCVADGSCTAVLAPGNSCMGTYQGTGTDCATTSCPIPTGACCLPDALATCTDILESDCAAAGGSFEAVGASCLPNPCIASPTPFLDALPLPAVAEPQTGIQGGAATYDMAIKQFSQTLHSELPPTTVWGFDDGTHGPSFPGPTIEVTSGVPITVTWKNELRGAGNQFLTSHHLPVDTCPHGADNDHPRTVIHLHGGHVPAAVDGSPDATFLPGSQAVYEYPNAQGAASIWYHDHALGITRLNVYMGMAGFYMVRDAAEEALGLPAGEFEVPLVIQDRTFKTDGSLVYPSAWQEHFFGNTLLVNGKVWPYFDVKQGKYRFRLLNGSCSRTYHLSLSNGATFQQIGTDGGLLDAPVTLSELLLMPGERADIVMDFSAYAAATEIVLQNDAPSPFPGPANAGVIPQVMKFVVTGDAGHSAALPASLGTVTPLDENDAVMSRDFELSKVSDPCTGSAWSINGLRWDDITEFPTLGTVEVWRFINDSGISHPMHMHLVFFQVLDRQPFDMQGGVPVATGPAVPPEPQEAGWKDTVRVDPGEMVRVIARFEDYVGRFAYHCHILEHEDHEMMRQFETTTACGDGATGFPDEECDDGNLVDGDGCSAECTLEGTGGMTGGGNGPGGGSTGGAGGGMGGGGAAGGQSNDDDGCGCRAVGSSLPPSGGAFTWTWLALCGGIAARSRRRRLRAAANE